jgi:hypothetical protein
LKDRQQISMLGALAGRGARHLTGAYSGPKDVAHRFRTASRSLAR